MNILILGAHGLLGKAFVDCQTFNVNCLSPSSSQLNLLRPETWRPWLCQADVIVNAVGLMAPDAGQMWALQYHALKAFLEQAWIYGRLRYVLNVSAWGADVASETAFLRSKGFWDAYLLQQNQAVGIVRPSLVFAQKGVSSRGLLTLAKQRWRVLPQVAWRPVLQPVALRDVVQAMQTMLQQHYQGCVNAVGGQVLSLVDYLAYMRLYYWQRPEGRNWAVVDARMMKILQAGRYLRLPNFLQADAIRMLQETHVAEGEAFAQLLLRTPQCPQQFLQDALHERF
ncbi:MULTISPECIES: hypothetical protein [Vitreoscilla]|uniref:Uncharacterized protein n=1 Tax=Vitreoscilla stercoraria TaxID=61 RepID=A0ABY4EAX0_VITST|nr:MULTISPECIES: hypothetical protein [Vitreoscilla]AUZ04164.1 NAD(P)-binding domain-containing protein [Vitreoscilla sp. C1]UOO92070.1 hypothetical protein LVJ81_10620 [Vitreoscilla stercoraria]